MFKRLLITIRNDRILQLLLCGSLLIQILFCITAVGFYHPDQHFQIVEFSSYQLGEKSGVAGIWELSSKIRPTLQVYIFSAFIKACRLFNIHDAYLQLTILRIIFGIIAFAVFNLICIYYFKKQKKVLYWVLLMLNLSWILPYTRTMFSSEMGSSVFFLQEFYYMMQQRIKIILALFYLPVSYSACRFTCVFKLHLRLQVLGYGCFSLKENISKYFPLLPAF